MDRRRFQGDCAADNPAFHKYTDIQNYWKYAPALPEGTPVRITEKIHGTNSRVGYIRTEAGGYVFMGGSHKTNRKEFDVAGNRSLYWRPLASNMLGLLVALSEDKHDVVVFGELFGPGIQDMDYGIVPGEIGYQVFDITVDGQYIDWDDLQAACSTHGIATVPLLYRGPFSKQVLDFHTDGPTTFGQVRSKFKGREGVVVTPLHETYSDVLGGRLILKNKSADYLDRRDAQDNE
jgi:RNA ligase (TIGR02306 family)